MAPASKLREFERAVAIESDSVLAEMLGDDLLRESREEAFKWHEISLSNYITGTGLSAESPRNDFLEVCVRLTGKMKTDRRKADADGY
ncbi:MAG: hypothetical protein M1286_01750 [Candidatus Marsarchaeota archaeon]|nr:hypothetical protein [Candidatus Marsarchaeota archaeon]